MKKLLTEFENKAKTKLTSFCDFKKGKNHGRVFKENAVVEFFLSFSSPWWGYVCAISLCTFLVMLALLVFHDSLHPEVNYIVEKVCGLGLVVFGIITFVSGALDSSGDGVMNIIEVINFLTGN